MIRKNKTTKGVTINDKEIRNPNLKEQNIKNFYFYFNRQTFK